ncbi:UDP-galactose transporter [Microbotryomycetes sp. JL201]|nr:UDP-galactose transporter [Microbotryomycetes sp. JL201]
MNGTSKPLPPRPRGSLPPLVQFGICVGGIYSSFLVWALCQERLSTTPYPTLENPKDAHKFRAVVFLNTVQSTFSALAALAFLLVTKRKPGARWHELLGLPLGVRDQRKKDLLATPLHDANGLSSEKTSSHPTATVVQRSATDLLKLYAFIALVASMASPFGFLSLSHISFPTLLLGKSCKLVPVMFMNIVLYRRKFPLHKYALVVLVTVGIWAFMAFKPSKGPAKGPATSSLLGMTLLGINLALDGVVNATQDHVFATFKPLDGPQMMLFMNLFSTIITSAALLWPSALTPSFLAPVGSDLHFNALSTALDFIRQHPLVKVDIILFGLTGAVGQLFIFATLSLYGSLTLVTITVTRKMATMLLSVFVFDHKLSIGQWFGVALVFGAVVMEAVIARRDKRKKPTAPSKLRPSPKVKDSRRMI